MNLSQLKRKKLLDYLKKLREKNEDDESRVLLNEIEIALTEKKYGLVWEKHIERVDKELEHNIPIFKEIEDKKIISNKNEKYNFLLEGDNLHSLKLLEKTHYEKIDVIYIDPPYNTGNKDFMYDDKMIDKNDGYSHSKWLSFMNERLTIAKNLLKSTGVIFISIDDNEQAQLKLLCDEIFGEENFIANIVVEAGGAFGAKTTHKNKTFIKVKDYVLVYLKNNTINSIKKPLYDKANEQFDPRYNFYIENNKKQSLINYFRDNEKISRQFLEYNLSVDKKNIITLMLISDKFREMMINELSKNIYKDSQFTLQIPKEIEEKLNENEIVKYKKYLLMKTQNGNIRHLQSFYETLIFNDELIPEFTRSVLRGDLWKNFVKDMGNVAKEGNIDFKNGKKPIRLIKQLIKWTNNKNSIILDFFAGSGTTGHAVMQLNKEDNGNRTYILCTNNENKICEEITYKRLKNIQEELPHNLKYYKTDFIPKYSQDENDKLVSSKMLDNLKELIELEYQVEIDGVKNIIIKNEEELENKIEGIDEKINLFLCSGIFLNKKQQRILEEKNIKVIDVPEYYFKSELKELGEI
ncbi:MAG: site-specific DNA-methyltransferase [Fusobacterium sp.]|nr:site-specific DNA-methyltransferase [Fusobacterium sp.]